jgi:uncharacterized protein YgfB (UPF0149 family)
MFKEMVCAGTNDQQWYGVVPDSFDKQKAVASYNLSIVERIQQQQQQYYWNLAHQQQVSHSSQNS